MDEENSVKGGKGGAHAATNVGDSPDVPFPMIGKPSPYDHVEEIMGILKTAYPLLALTMETMVRVSRHMISWFLCCF